MGGGKSPEARYAIQSWYKLQIDAKSLKVNCNEVIKIPLCLSLLDPTYKYMVPCIVVTTDFTSNLAAIKIVIETSEGLTVEPFKVLSNSHFGWVYVLALPPKTTGLKNVNVFVEQGGRRFILQSALSFEIMEPPYNYEGAALENVSSLAQRNENAISELESKVEDLTPHYGYKTPNGEHTVDFSSESTPFEIKPDTRLLTFTLNNTASTDVNFNCYIAKTTDDSKRSEVTLTLKPGSSVVKIDLLTHVVYVRPSTPVLLVTETYSTSGIVDSAYDAINFSYIPNDKIRGASTVYEWK